VRFSRSAAALLGCLAAAGCSDDSATTLLIQVTDPQVTRLDAVDVKVLGPHGTIAQKRVSPAPLPGRLTVKLPDEALDLRVVVATVATPPLLNAVMAHAQPHTQVTAQLTLDGIGLADADGDGVPDAFDDCPSVPDPDQASASGMYPGDACGGGVPGDMAVTLDDMGHVVPVDLAAPGDLAAPPPDLAPAVSLCPGTFLLCDGFESGTISSAVWNTVTQNGTITVDSTRAFRGTRSLKASNGAGGGTAVVFETGTFAAGKAPSHFFTRAFVLVPSGFAPTPAAIFAAEQTGSPFHQINVQLDSGGFSSFDTLQPTPGTLGPVSSPAMPKDRWVCLEWEVDVINGVVNLWVDGTKEGTLSTTGQQLNSTPAVGELVFGQIASATGDVWLDEIAVDSTRVTCAR
jgi:hypothetical protein